MRRLILALGCALAFAGLAPAQAKAKPKAIQAPSDAKVVRDLAYGTHQRQKLDLYIPNKGENLPLVVWVHGGGWQAGSKAGGGPARVLTSKGYAVASIGYRLTDAAPFPAQIQDCKGAIRWLKLHAKQYGYDADHIGVFGASAGGHLVALLGLAADKKDLEGDLNPGPDTKVQAMIDWFGPTDFLNWGAKGAFPPANTANGAVDKLLGGPPAENRDKAKSASPITYVRRDCPPILIMHGDKDGLVPLQQSQLLYDELKKAGADATLHVVVGGGHGAPGFQTPEVADMIVKFFDRTLKKKT